MAMGGKPEQARGQKNAGRGCAILERTVRNEPTVRKSLTVATTASKASGPNVSLSSVDQQAESAGNGRPAGRPPGVGS
jgi:hypothetical protein